ncbi:MAG TPA: translational GTPase TypA [Actinomycetota bacterium]|nr:translational GTPase TypA [Actinomycetota bacterium]
MTEIRNVALVAHVDHGKTTLVDAMLRASGVLRANTTAPDRVMDSNDLEREKGITIFAKAAQIPWKGITINLVDTPGHADFGGEVERALAMVDGIILIVDAAEGPLPQTRYVLQKALHRGLPSIVLVNKIDRKDARAEEVLDEIYQLYFDLEAQDHHIDFPVFSAIARDGKVVKDIAEPPEDADLSPLLDAIVERIPAPSGDSTAPLQALVTNLDASDYLGRLAIGRVVQGTLRVDDSIALCRDDGSTERRKLTALERFEGLSRVRVDEIYAGDLFVAAGLPDVEIGDTLADPDAPVALGRLIVDEPVLRMTFGVSTSPMSGREGKFLTSRHLKERLDREVLGNVSIRVTPTDSPEVIEVAGRGELQLAVLIETMRREGYEFQVSRPEVITREIEGVLHEPLERGIVDVPDEHVGTVSQNLAPRKGKVVDIRPGDAGRSIVTFEAPARGLIGFRTLLLTATRGTALLHLHAAGYIPWVGDLPHRQGGAMVADRIGKSTAYALDSLQPRGVLLIGPGEEVYEGMVVGEHSRPDELVVNVTREKQKTNIRTHASDEAIKLEPPRQLTVETAIEFIAGDELVEVTPQSLRVRKRHLDRRVRERAAKAQPH